MIKSMKLKKIHNLFYALFLSLFTFGVVVADDYVPFKPPGR